MTQLNVVCINDNCYVYEEDEDGTNCSGIYSVLVKLDKEIP